MKRRLPAVFFLFLVFLSLACQSVPFLAHPTPTPTVTPTPTKTRTPTPSPSPTGILGITMPVTVDGVQMQFTSVATASHYKVGTIDYKPTSSANVFLVADADVLSENVAYADVKDWKVTLNDNIKWTIVVSHGKVGDIDSLTWVFVVKKTETSFEIHFPGGVDILLDNLLQ
jgi:hypothetical protein